MKTRAGSISSAEIALSQRGTPSEQRALRLFVVRESDEQDDELFNAMREQTYLPHRHEPAVEAVRAAGMAPAHAAAAGGTGAVVLVEELPDGTTANRQVLVEQLRVGGTQALLFHFGGIWHLWSQASAAKVADSGVNEFTEILIEVVRRVRPRNLHAANFSRLIRSLPQGAKLQSNLDGNVDCIWAGTDQLHLTGSQASIGFVMFSMFAMVASMERDWIVLRLLAGRVAKWRRGEWPYGSATIPFGYRYNTTSKQLEVDHDLRPAVREMLLVLSGTAPAQEMKRQLARAGVISMRANKRTGRRVTVEAQANAHQLLTSLYSWASVWCAGEYLFRVSNVLPGIDELSGVPITRHSDRKDDSGELQMLCMVPVPEGGWAEPDILQAFELAAVRHARQLGSGGRSASRPLAPQVQSATTIPALHAQVLGGPSRPTPGPDVGPRRAPARSRRVIAPLTGRSWVHDGWHYELQSSTRDLYRLLRWPIEHVGESVATSAVSTRSVDHNDDSQDGDDRGTDASPDGGRPDNVVGRVNHASGDGGSRSTDAARPQDLSVQPW